MRRGPSAINEVEAARRESPRGSRASDVLSSSDLDEANDVSGTGDKPPPATVTACIVRAVGTSNNRLGDAFTPAALLCNWWFNSTASSEPSHRTIDGAPDSSAGDWNEWPSASLSSLSPELLAAARKPRRRGAQTYVWPMGARDGAAGGAAHAEPGGGGAAGGAAHAEVRHHRGGARGAARGAYPGATTCVFSTRYVFRVCERWPQTSDWGSRNLPWRDDLLVIELFVISVLPTAASGALDATMLDASMPSFAVTRGRPSSSFQVHRATISAARLAAVWCVGMDVDDLLATRGAVRKAARGSPEE